MHPLPAAEVRYLESLEPGRVQDPAAVSQLESPRERGGVASAGQRLGDGCGLLLRAAHQGIDQGGLAHPAFTEQQGALGVQLLSRGPQRCGRRLRRGGDNRIAERTVCLLTRRHRFAGHVEVLLGRDQQAWDCFCLQCNEDPNEQGFIEARVTADDDARQVDVRCDRLGAEVVAARYTVAAGKDRVDDGLLAVQQAEGDAVADDAVAATAPHHCLQEVTAFRWA
jgi:hypothetical protein